jgi:hypothetical protein
MDGTIRPATFLGLMTGEESRETLAVVRFDDTGYGMFLFTYHPSRVTLTGDQS